MFSNKSNNKIFEGLQKKHQENITEGADSFQKGWTIEDSEGGTWYVISSTKDSVKVIKDATDPSSEVKTFKKADVKITSKNKVGMLPNTGKKEK